MTKGASSRTHLNFFCRTYFLANRTAVAWGPWWTVAIALKLDASTSNPTGSPPACKAPHDARAMRIE
jgi:hypothetical protein